MIYPVLLAGGSGTRMWPLSREHSPKQFLPLVSAKSMFQETVSRLEGMGAKPPLVVCNDIHRFMLSDQLREINLKPLEVITEPVGRNTAPALTLAVLHIQNVCGGQDTDPIILSMHSDHLIQDTSAFHSAVVKGVELAQRGYLVTFGVPPDTPETGYGYIRKGSQINDINQANVIDQFVEKPDPQTAREYLGSGDYLWNSGIFMMKQSVWFSELGRHRPDILAAAKLAYDAGSDHFEFFRPGVEEFLRCPSESIDYAVMEPATSSTDQSVRCAVIELEAGWSDIGSWSAIWARREKDSNGNVTLGDVYASGTTNSLLMAEQRLLATVGVSDVVVIETPDAVLVSRKDRVQEVKQIVERLKADRRTETEVNTRVHRPWGSYEVLDSGQNFQVKRLTVNPGASLSLQYHHHRAEHWVVVGGTAKVTRDGEVFTLTANESTYVSPSSIHRLENPSDEPLLMIEVQTGDYLDEDDIVRLEDNYNRLNDA